MPSGKMAEIARILSRMINRSTRIRLTLADTRADDGFDGPRIFIAQFDLVQR